MHVIWFLMFQRVNMTILMKKKVEEKKYTCASTIGSAEAKIQDISSPVSPASNSTASSSGNEDSPREHSE